MIARSRQVEEALLREVEWENRREEELAKFYAEWQARERRRQLWHGIKLLFSWAALIGFCLLIAEALKLLVTP